jgi:type VI secretion system protein ImpC
MDRFEFEYATETRTRTAPRRRAEGPLRILVLGDFSGRTNRGAIEAGAGLADRPVTPVDVDVFDDVLYRFAPRLHLPAGGADAGGMAVEFERLEDFHPDGMFERLELFRGLGRMRERLLDPATFAEAARELRPETGGAATADGPGPAAAPAEDDSATLQRLLGRRPADLSRRGPEPAPRLDLDAILRRIVEPHVVPGADPRQAEVVSGLDAGIAGQMRALLHHPDFQELEAAWRSLHGLVTSVETGEGIELFLLDVSKEELAADLGATTEDFKSSGAFGAVVDRPVRSPGGGPWSVLVGNYTFGPSAGDVALLVRLGLLGSQAGGSFLAAADPAILGCDLQAQASEPHAWRPREDDAERWSALRRNAAAPWLGLVVPRLLLRLPYGQAGDRVDAFEFEELGPQPDHAAFLWGNGAFGCARLIAQTFRERGWSMEPGEHLDVHDLPAFVYEEGGERKLKPCAEVALTERAGTGILSRGLMPLLSYRDRNAARLMRFQSLADPATGIAGPWV